VTATVALDGSGLYTLRLNGNALYEIIVDQITVSLSQTVVAIQGKTYKNTVSPGNFISQTRTGYSDTDSQPNLSLYPGEGLLCVWGGLGVSPINGEQATISIRGVIQDGL
jgi:hypothetical protein